MPQPAQRRSQRGETPPALRLRLLRLKQLPMRGALAPGGRGGKGKQRMIPPKAARPGERANRNKAAACESSVHHRSHGDKCEAAQTGLPNRSA